MAKFVLGENRLREIERKYLARLRDCSLPQPDESMHVKQGYVVSAKYFEWRLRRAIHIVPRDKPMSFTTAVKFGNGFIRREYEWEIPQWLFKQLGKLVPQWIRKSRYSIDGWEIDRFQGELWPLVLVEYEAPASDWIIQGLQPPKPPPGITLLRDVTNVGTFANKRLGRLTPDEARELLIDEVVDLGGGFTAAECSVHRSLASEKQQEPEVQCSGECG